MNKLTADSVNNQASLVNEVVRRILIHEESENLSLQLSIKGAEVLSNELKQVFLTPLRALVGSLKSKSEFEQSFINTLDAFAVKIAELQTDNFVLKSHLLSKKPGFGFGPEKHFDPVRMIREIIATEQSAATNERSKVVTEIQLGSQILGYGWHAHEASETGHVWRWMGPDTRSSLVIPAFGSGIYRISFKVSFLDGTVLDSLKLSLNNNEVTEVRINNRTANTADVDFDYIFNDMEVSNFLIMDFAVCKTISPNELDQLSTDKRLLGLGLGSLRLEKE